MWSAVSGNPGLFSPGHISVSVRMFSRKSANLLYYIFNYGNVLTYDATKAKIESAVSEPGDKINFHYDFGDDWRVALTLEKAFTNKDLPGSELPRVLDGAGLGIIEDAGGVGGLAELAKAFKKKKGADYKQFCEWLGVDDLDLSAFDLDDMNFRLKKIPRIYKQCYEDRITPTQYSINLIERKYLKKSHDTP